MYSNNLRLLERIFWGEISKILLPLESISISRYLISENLIGRRKARMIYEGEEGQRCVGEVRGERWLDFPGLLRRVSWSSVLQWRRNRDVPFYPLHLQHSGNQLVKFCSPKSLDSTVLQILEATVVSSPGQRSFYGFTGKLATSLKPILIS